MHETLDGRRLAELAGDALADRKAEEIALLDVRGLSSITDYVLVATGGSEPHLKALYNEVQKRLKGAGSATYRRAGKPEGGWLVLDYIDLVIHIFSRPAREYYAIEELWPEAPRTALPPGPPPAGPAS